MYYGRENNMYNLRIVYIVTNNSNVIVWTLALALEFGVPLSIYLFFIFLSLFIFLWNVKADAPVDDGKSPFVTARAVTTRTATTHEDLGTNARTQQLEEKTVAHSMTSSATRQEQRTVTQEVKTTSTVVSGDQVIIFFVHLCSFVVLC